MKVRDPDLGPKIFCMAEFWNKKRANELLNTVFYVIY